MQPADLSGRSSSGSRPVLGYKTLYIILVPLLGCHTVATGTELCETCRSWNEHTDTPHLLRTDTPILFMPRTPTSKSRRNMARSSQTCHRGREVSVQHMNSALLSTKVAQPFDSMLVARFSVLGPFPSCYMELSIVPGTDDS